MKRWMLLLAGLLPGVCGAATQVNVVGLFSGKAVLVVNGGKPRTLSVGQATPEGVRLLAADSSRAVLEIEGKRQELGMGQGASVAGEAAQAPTALLYANQAGHFLGDGSINGKSVRFLVDTGASVVVLNSVDATRLGLDFVGGPKGAAQTAAGVVRAHHVRLNTLRIGGITLHGVDAMVLDGTSPPVALLGMSALNRMEMNRDGLVLTLTKKY